MSLSVMGHQKDVKENAYSQVSAKISYKESALSKKIQSKSPSILSTVNKVAQKADAERQLNLINLDKLESKSPSKNTG